MSEPRTCKKSVNGLRVGVNVVCFGNLWMCLSLARVRGCQWRVAFERGCSVVCLDVDDIDVGVY